MIITFTANPSLDRTIELPGPLARGEVQRAVAAAQQPGGKGVNVSRALVASAEESLALLPGDDDDAVVAALRAEGIPHRTLPIGRPLRSNVTVTEPDGTTTKINEPGPTLTDAQRAELLALVVSHGADASWLVLAGSLPPGLPEDFYVEVILEVRSRWGARAPRIAVDSSGAPLAAVLAAGPDAAPDLIKPNAEELAELTGVGHGDSLESDPEEAARAAAGLVEGGVGTVLATLGSKGALVVTAQETFRATHPPVTARSTVGAGDSSLAGFLIASTRGADLAGCARQAVAHGAAAASLPGSSVPTLEQTTPDAVELTPLTRSI
ncbi:1-phosphofructokinase [Tersicoccus solisilvae]|uniref:1-phosphofructokinase n=1 Tax=Tersicoccus solisilvae TaxID=1882339 RepID=A0ABQ1NV65_9MICC|nr:1-phosphofructokinase family hexose kinase [Tersicoccus solisilvae]GGC83519.1 1-phosphofructokinase [Tersicoccus solisilvae]